MTEKHFETILMEFEKGNIEITFDNGKEVVFQMADKHGKLGPNLYSWDLPGKRTFVFDTRTVSSVEYRKV